MAPRIYNSTYFMDRLVWQKRNILEKVGLVNYIVDQKVAIFSLFIQWISNTYCIPSIVVGIGIIDKVFDHMYFLI